MFLICSDIYRFDAKVKDLGFGDFLVKNLNKKRLIEYYDADDIIINHEDIKYGFHVLSAVEVLKDQLGEQKVQPKYIIEKLKSVISSQTVYMTLQSLVDYEYLIKYQKGKFSFYDTTAKGIELLNKIRESHNKSIAEPLVENMVQTLRDKYPKELKDVSDRDLNNYLYIKIKEFEFAIIKDAVSNFIK